MNAAGWDPDEYARDQHAREFQWHLDEQARERMEQHADEAWWTRPIRHTNASEEPDD